MNLCSLVMLCGGSISRIAGIFSGTTQMPLGSVSCLRNFTTVWWNLHSVALVAYSLQCSGLSSAVLSFVCCDYQHIIRLADHTIQPCQDFVHSLLEEFWCTGYTEWDFIEVIPPK